MAKYKFVNEDEKKIAFKDLKPGDIFCTFDTSHWYNFGKIVRIPRIKLYSYSPYANSADLLSGTECFVDDNSLVMKYTGTLIFDEKDWTDKK